VIFLQQQNYIRVYETCLPFSIIRSERVGGISRNSLPGTSGKGD
jgi:hypothetical protein